MRRTIVFLLILVLTLVWLPGCGAKTPKDEGPISINPDGTVGLLRWGMTRQEAEKADRRIVFAPDPEHMVNTCNLTFLDHEAGLSLFFRSFPEEGEDAPERLYMIRAFLRLKKGEPDYVPMVGAYFAGGREELSYGSGGWASAETLEDRIPRERLEALWPEGVETGRTTQPLWQAAAISTRGPADAGGIPAKTGDREFSYNAMGYNQVLADILRGRG